MPSRLRSTLHRLSRHAAAMYLTALALGVVIVLVPPARRPIVSGMESVIDASDRVWLDRVEEGEALVEEGRFEEAAAFLANLDARFPARTNINSFDQEREEILRALGRANEGLGRKGRALDAYRRAVAFEPLDVENHYALAAAAIRLDEMDEAERELTLIVDTYPPHVRATAALIAIEAERGDFEAVRRTFESYTGSFWLAHVTITAGAHTEMADLPVDGRSHALRFGLPAAAEGARAVTIDLDGAEIGLDSVRWTGRLVVGGGARVEGIAPATAEPSTYALPDPTPAELVVTATALIPIDAETWASVDTAYRNLLATARLDELRPRIRIEETGP